MNKIVNNRLLSLDVLRGITIAGMILVNNPGDWDNIYEPLRHADWNGLTPTDLVFPFFMFIMGISTYISLRKTEFTYSLPTFLRILKRTIIIFLIGLGLSWISLSISAFYSLVDSDLNLLSKLAKSIVSLDNLRVLGVMQRLALCYGATSLIAVFVKHKYIIFLTIMILIAYYILLLVGNGFERGDSNILSIVDQNVLGPNHMYNEYGLDPEGLLSTIPSIAHVLIGFCIGKILMDIKDNRERMLQLFIYGAILTFVGLLFSYACPINKKIWSPSYVLVTCGMASTLLSLLIWFIDVKGYKKWSVFFESFGANPLFIYVFASLLATIIDELKFPTRSMKEMLYDGMLLVGLGDHLTSCLFAILFVVACWSVGHVLYKKRIYIKI